MYLTVKEMAGDLKVSEKTIRRKIWNGELAHVKIGESVRVAKDDFDAYVAGKVKVRPEPRPEAQ